MTTNNSMAKEILMKANLKNIPAGQEEKILKEMEKRLGMMVLKLLNSRQAADLNRMMLDKENNSPATIKVYLKNAIPDFDGKAKKMLEQVAAELTKK